MVSEGLITNVVTIIVLIFLVVTFILPKKIRYAVHGTLLLALGLIPILYEFNVLSFTFGEAGIWKYIIAVVVIFTARSLMAEGIKEQGPVRWVSIVVGAIVIILATVPALYNIGALTFTIPQYPAIIDHFLYVIAAILLYLGIFLGGE